MEEYINKYFDLISSNIKRHISNLEFSKQEKERLEMRLEIINELRGNINWHFKSPEQKQSSRIQVLASMRRSDAPEHQIKTQEKIIEIYEYIKSTIPYIEALNNNLNIPIIDFLNSFCDKVDLAGSSFNGIFPPSQEIDKVFKPYFDIVLVSKGNGGMFKECYEKIGKLFDLLKKL